MLLLWDVQVLHVDDAHSAAGARCLLWALLCADNWLHQVSELLATFPGSCPAAGGVGNRLASALLQVLHLHCGGWRGGNRVYEGECHMQPLRMHCSVLARECVLNWAGCQVQMLNNALIIESSQDTHNPYSFYSNSKGISSAVEIAAIFLLSVPTPVSVLLKSLFNVVMC